MPKGFSAIKQAADKIDSQSNDFLRVLFLKLPDDGDSAVVRFLEQADDVYSYWYHDFSHVDEYNGWKTKVPCLDQEDEGVPCPGCREDLPRRFQGLINLIWRDAPVFKRDADGKVVKKSGQIVIDGYEDQIAVWRGGIQLFSKVLARKDVTYKGLTTRDFEVTREGKARDPKTTYSVEPADVDAKASKLTKADAELGKEKYDLQQVASFVDEDTFDKIIAKKLNDTEDDDDDEDIKKFIKSDPYGEDNEG